MSSQEVHQQISTVNRGRHWISFSILLPLVLAAALYLSVLFAVFSAIPLIYAHCKHGRVVGIVASFTNTALVWYLAGQVNAAVFFIVGVVLAIAIAESLKLKLKIEWQVSLAIFMMLFTSTLLALSYSKKFHVKPWERLDAIVGQMVDKVVTDIETYKASGKAANQDLEKFLADPQMTKKNIILELPSFVGIMFLVISVLNVLVTLRFNPGGISQYLKLDSQFFKHWKAPELLVWPTIAAGLCLIIEVPYLSPIALNLFKILMAIYAIHGLAITSYLFDVWGLKSFIRPIGYFIAIAILLPLVISLGFFDMWFGFREKFRRSV